MQAGGYGGFGAGGFGAGMGGGIASLLQGLFGNSGAPSQAGIEAFEKFLGPAFQYMQPYNAMGLGALNNIPNYLQQFQGAQGQYQDTLGQYQNALNRMSDPQAYVNQILSGYQMSPAAQFQLQQGQKAMGNAASASGMLGSGQFSKEMMDYSQGLTSRDMNQYLNNVLGVNQTYLNQFPQLLGGERGLMSGIQGEQGLNLDEQHLGFQGASGIMDLIRQLAQNEGIAAGQEAQGQQSDLSSLFGGIGSLLFGL